VVVLLAGVLRNGVQLGNGVVGLLFPLRVVVAQEPGVLFRHLDVAAAATDDLLRELLHRVEGARVAVVLAVRLADVLDDFAGELAVLVVEFPRVELVLVEVVRDVVEAGVVRGFDPCRLDGVLRRDVAVPPTVRIGTGSIASTSAGSMPYSRMRSSSALLPAARYSRPASGPGRT